jgi:hypothetical protein
MEQYILHYVVENYKQWINLFINEGEEVRIMNIYDHPVPNKWYSHFNYHQLVNGEKIHTFVRIEVISQDNREKLIDTGSHGDYRLLVSIDPEFKLTKFDIARLEERKAKWCYIPPALFECWYNQQMQTAKPHFIFS